MYKRQAPWRATFTRAIGQDCTPTSITPAKWQTRFHVVAAANRFVDHVRRRVQNELLGHRGRKDDPLYKIRRVLLTGAERLNPRGVDRMALGLRLGDSDDDVLRAWLAKEYERCLLYTSRCV